MTSPGGRIAARFYRSDTTENPRAKAEPKSPAQGEAAGFVFRTDPTAPINIDAESLLSSDQTKTATFRGKVVAVQGDFRIETPEMVATYTGDASLAGSGADLTGTVTAKGKGASEKREGPELQRIRANRGVLVTSTNNQEVRGDWADFDVKSNSVTVGGDVTVKQGGNTIRGPKLVIDMTSGQSRMETATQGGWQVVDPGVQLPPTVAKPGAPTGQAAAAASAAIARGECGARMCAVFHPQELKDRARKKAEEIAPGVDIEAAAKRAEEAVRKVVPKSISEWEAKTTGR
jgi:lipopolysaccharide export system protein LptA